MQWKGNSIVVEPPKRPKKLTATRFATVLGLNPWQTQFEVWCEITKTYQKPFEDTKYTLAGKAIEPKQIAYMKKAYFMTNLKTPTDIYGTDYFNKTYGDFFSSEKIFGGMWDSLLYEDGKPSTVLEFKTTKRAEDWETDVPEYYALQAALYAYLLGVDDVIMVASFLEDSDYESPHTYNPSANNTTVIEFKVSERYPYFQEEYLTPATVWWNKYVLSGTSPEFDEKKDSEILKILRTNNVNPSSDLNKLIKEAEFLKEKIEAVYLSVTDDAKRLKNIQEQIKKIALLQFRDGDKKVSFTGQSFEWIVSKIESIEIDKDKLKQDGIFENYAQRKSIYRLTTNSIKEDI